jgi:hypothetical protein
MALFSLSRSATRSATICEVSILPNFNTELWRTWLNTRNANKQHIFGAASSLPRSPAPTQIRNTKQHKSYRYQQSEPDAPIQSDYQKCPNSQRNESKADAHVPISEQPVPA